MSTQSGTGFVPSSPAASTLVSISDTETWEKNKRFTVSIQQKLTSVEKEPIDIVSGLYVHDPPLYLELKSLTKNAHTCHQKFSDSFFF